MFKFIGYDVVLKESSPGKPERIVRIWNLIFIAWILFILIFVAQVTK